MVTPSYLIVLSLAACLRLFVLSPKIKFEGDPHDCTISLAFLLS